MKRIFFLKQIALLLLLTLIVAAASGCGKEASGGTTLENAGISDTSDASAPDLEPIGEGAYSFPFTVVFADGTSRGYLVSTDAETVGEALLALDLIDGEAGAFGLYVKSVCGVTADYDKDQTYWALYVDGEMSTTGVDGVRTDSVSSVEFRVEK